MVNIQGLEGVNIVKGLKTKPLINLEDPDQLERRLTKGRPKKKKLEDLRTENEEKKFVKTALNLADQLSKIEHTQDDLICPLCLKFIVKASVARCGHTYCYICF